MDEGGGDEPKTDIGAGDEPAIVEAPSSGCAWYSVLISTSGVDSRVLDLVRLDFLGCSGLRLRAAERRRLDEDVALDLELKSLHARR